jgi:hypothetical protein
MVRAGASGAQGSAGSSAVNGGGGAVAQPASTPQAISVMRYRFMVSLPSPQERVWLPQLAIQIHTARKGSGLAITD